MEINVDFNDMPDLDDNWTEDEWGISSDDDDSSFGDSDGFDDLDGSLSIPVPHVSISRKSLLTLSCHEHPFTL